MISTAYINTSWGGTERSRAPTENCTNSQTLFVSEWSIVARQTSFISYSLLWSCVLKRCWAWVTIISIITSSFLILSNFSDVTVCLICFYGDNFDVFFHLSFSFIINKRLTAHINTQAGPAHIHLRELTNWQTSFEFERARHCSALQSSYSKIHPLPRREPTMSGKERSPRHRPWSVYRANTFDLSAEMMGLALSGI